MPRRNKTLVIDMPPAQGFSEPVAPASLWIDDALFYGTMALLMFGVVAFGATVPWAQFVLRTVALLLLALWAVRQYLQGTVEMANNPLLLPALIFCALVLTQLVTAWTSYRYATLEEALNLIPCGTMIFIAGEIFTRRRRLRQALTALALFGFAIAFLAILQDLSTPGKIYWAVTVHGISAVPYGPYANHNHYAGLMEMLAPVTVAAGFLERGAKRGLLLFAAAIMVVSIVFSRSRGGMISLLVAGVFVCAVLLHMNRRARVLLAVLASVGFVSGLTLLLANDRVLQRLTETQDLYRLTIYRDCLRMWLHKPLFGFGFGTFPTVYPEYRSFFTNLLVNRAHNDYLELLVDMGLLGIAVAGWFLFLTFRHALRKIVDRDDREGSVMTIGLLAAIVALLAHSALDFNLHIPANAAIFYTLCAAAATPFRRRLRQLEFTSWETDEEPIMVDRA